MAGADHFFFRHDAEQQQGLVQFIFRPWIGPSLRGDLLDRSGVQNPQAVIARRLKGPTGVNGVSAPLFQWRIIQKCIRTGTENFVRERRRLGKIPGHASDPALFDVAQQLFETVDIHRFGETIINGLIDQRVIGQLTVARKVFRTSELVRKNRGEQIL